MTAYTPPTLSDLPPPPPGRSGWPWTEAPGPLPPVAPSGRPWPRISLVTPSYNQAEYVEETVRSVLLQGYPALEYVVLDGASTDGAAAVVERYGPWLTDWRSRPDRGQTDAIQQGLDRATGALWNWLNSDDYYEPGALRAVAEAYDRDPTATAYAGAQTFVGDHPLAGRQMRPFDGLEDLLLIRRRTDETGVGVTPQPALFLRTGAVRRAGGLDASLRYPMDLDLYLRVASEPGFRVVHLGRSLARFRLHPESKTLADQDAFDREVSRVLRRFVLRHPGRVPAGAAFEWWRTEEAVAFHRDVRDLSARRGVAEWGGFGATDLARLLARHPVGALSQEGFRGHLRNRAGAALGPVRDAVRLGRRLFRGGR